MALPFSLLCDVDKSVVQQYHLLNRHEHGGIAYPAIFVIKANGKIGYRSLDKTAKRVDLHDLLDYLDTASKDSEFTFRSTANKHFVRLSASGLAQLGKNMIFRGTKEDWLHYLRYPLFILRSIFRKR